MDLSPTVILAFTFGLLILLTMSGIYIAFTLLLVGLFLLLLLTPHMVGSIGFHMFNAIDSFTLVAIPLFIFMGQITLYAGLGEKLYDGVTKITNILPGGLTHTNIAACAVFAAISGSASATQATIGSIAVPDQSARGYQPRLLAGSISCGSTLGVLIPPSVIMIIYGSFCQVSVARLFIAGVIPGIILTLLFMSWIVIQCLIWPERAPKREKLTWRYFPRALSAFTDIWPVLLLAFFIMGSIYSGLATPTEAAAISLAGALGLAALFRRLNFNMLRKAMMAMLRPVCFVGIAIVGGRLMGIALSISQLPTILMEGIAALGLSPMVVWVIIVVVYLIMGCLMEDISLMLVTLPVTFPLVIALGFDPVWFGVLVTVLVQIAQVTPPIGMHIYIMKNLWPEYFTLEDIIIGIFPFALVMIVAVGIYSAFPQLVLWLPNLAFG